MGQTNIRLGMPGPELVQYGPQLDRESLILICAGQIWPNKGRMWTMEEFGVSEVGQ